MRFFLFVWHSHCAMWGIMQCSKLNEMKLLKCTKLKSKCRTKDDWSAVFFSMEQKKKKKKKNISSLEYGLIKKTEISASNAICDTTNQTSVAFNESNSIYNDRSIFFARCIVWKRNATIKETVYIKETVPWHPILCVYQRKRWSFCERACYTFHNLVLESLSLSVALHCNIVFTWMF